MLRRMVGLAIPFRSRATLWLWGLPEKTRIRPPSQTAKELATTTRLGDRVQCTGAVYVYRNLDKLSDPNLRVSEQSSNSITLSWHSNMGLADRVKIVPATMEKKHPLAAMMPTPSRLMPTSPPTPTTAFPQHQIRLSGVCL
jgi:hypothetical protein